MYNILNRLNTGNAINIHIIETSRLINVCLLMDKASFQPRIKTNTKKIIITIRENDDMINLKPLGLLSTTKENITWRAL